MKTTIIFPIFKSGGSIIPEGYYSETSTDKEHKRSFVGDEKDYPRNPLIVHWYNAIPIEKEDIVKPDNEGLFITVIKNSKKELLNLERWQETL